MQNSTSGVLVASPSSVLFGAVKVGNTSAVTVSLSNEGATPIELSNFGVNGKSFSASSNSILPLTLAPGASVHVDVKFKPAAAGKVAGQLTITSKSFASGTEAVDLSGSGAESDSPTATASLGSLSCANASVTGSGDDACKVTLTSAAPSGGLSVSLTSSSGVVKVPGSVTVAASSTSADFNASISAVNAAETVQLKAADGGVTSTFDLKLNPHAAGTSGAGSLLSVSSQSVAFGDVALNSTATQALTLSSTGGSPLTIDAVTLTGAGFKVSGASFPLTLAARQTATLNVEFDPAATGTEQGALTITSDASNGGKDVVALTGTGVSHKVELTWNAPSNSPVKIDGYHVYRTTSGGSVYQLLNSTIDQTTTYTDGSVQSGETYNYVVKAVDAEGVESPPSNETSVAIP